MKVAETLKEARAALGGDFDAKIDADALLKHVLCVNSAWLIAHSQDEIPEESAAGFRNLLQRRIQGEPVAYIVGHREFYGLDFLVNQDTLIPRPDTELLVELALERIAQNVLDLGTGSGAVAIAVARNSKSRVTAVDRSKGALEVATVNAQRLGADVRFLESDWFSGLDGEKFGLIVSNPPYVAEGDPHLDDLSHEPVTALTSGPDGLDSIRKIVSDAPSHLEPGGWLLFEHGYDQGQACREILVSNGFSDVATWRDLAGIERVSGGKR